MNEPTKVQFLTKFKLIMMVLLITISLLSFFSFNIPELSQTFLQWLKNLGSFQVMIFILIYSCATVLMVPGSILTLGAGIIFGIWWGSIYVFIAASCGAILAFLIGRYLFRDWVFQLIENNPKFAAIDSAVAQSGLKIVFLTRLSPIFPFTFLNYAFGVTQVSLTDYIIGLIGMIPGTIMYVYFGYLAGNIATLGIGNQPTPQTLTWIKLGFGLITTVIVTIYLTKIAKKALDETVNQPTD